MSKVKGIFLIVALLVSMTIPASAGSFDRATLDGVVYISWEGIIETVNDHGQVVPAYVSTSGSGFFVGKTGEAPKYIVTNHHVIEGFLNVDDVAKKYAAFLQDYLNVNENAKREFPLLVWYDKDTCEEVYVVDYDEEKDIAVLELAEPTGLRAPLAFRLSKEELVGSTVWAVGYPGVSDQLAGSVTSYGKNDATITIGSINRMFMESGTGIKTYQTDAKVRSGNSGGPLVDEHTNVLGINTKVAKATLDPNLNYAVCIDEVVPLLNKNSIPYTIYEESALTQPVLLGAAAVAVVAIVVLALVMKKKGKNAGPSEAAKKPAEAAARLTPVVRSLSAQHNGMSVELSGGAVDIGRDVSSCRIVFKDGTPGVSARHCRLSYDADKDIFLLTDLGSTYGTYLADGQKLTPQVAYALKRHDTFYLGEADNTLSVDLR